MRRLTTPSRTRTRQRRSRTLVALLSALSLMLPASAAFADLSDGIGTTGKGDGSGTSGPSYGCTADHRRTQHGVAFTRVHWPSCDSPSWTSNLRTKLCPTGLLQYRFYGTRDGHIDTVTVGRANLPNNDCGKDSFPPGGRRLFYPDPADAGVKPVSPYENRTSTNIYGERVAYAEPRPAPGTPEFPAGENVTTNPTILWSNGRSCAAFQNDLVARQIAGDPSSREFYEKDIYQHSYLPRKRLGPLSAARSFSNSFTVDDKNKRVNYGDSTNCSSTWDFASWKSDVDAHNYAAQRVVGDCFTFLEREGTHFSATVSGKTVDRYGYDLKAPEAINNYQTDKYDKTLPDGSRNSQYEDVDRRPGEEKMPNYFLNWRNFIQQHAPELGDNQPHQKYTSLGRWDPIDRTLAASQFARTAFCHQAPQAVVVPKCDPKKDPKCQEPCPPPPPGSLCPPPCPGQPAPSCPPVNNKQKQAAPPGMLNIDLNVPDVFQVGGFERPGVVLATSGGFHDCNLPACALSGLVYHVKLTGIGGYIDCRGQASSSCDFTVRDPNNTKVGSGEDAPIVSSDELTAAFYTAGTPAKKVKVELDVTTSVYAWTHCHPTPAGCDYHRHHFNDFTPTFTFSQHDGTSSGKHAEVIVDVIGANNAKA